MATHKSNQNSLLQQATDHLNDWLEKHKLRKTNERYTILNEIYNRNDHADAETLFNDLNKKNKGISRATVYNTLDLLVESNLVKKHQFQNNFAQFEKALGSRQHDHLICLECNDVFEFCDPRMEQISSKMGELLHFDVDTHSVILYGHCRGCNKPQSPKKTIK